MKYYEVIDEETCKNVKFNLLKDANSFALSSIKRKLALPFHNDYYFYFNFYGFASPDKQIKLISLLKNNDLEAIEFWNSNARGNFQIFIKKFNLEEDDLRDNSFEEKFEKIANIFLATALTEE
jgi:hypothetical protein